MKRWAALSAAIHKTVLESGELDITDILRGCPKDPPAFAAEPLRRRTTPLQNYTRSGMLSVTVCEIYIQKQNKLPRRR